MKLHHNACVYPLKHNTVMRMHTEYLPVRSKQAFTSKRTPSYITLTAPFFAWPLEGGGGQGAVHHMETTVTNTQTHTTHNVHTYTQRHSRAPPKRAHIHTGRMIESTHTHTTHTHTHTHTYKHTSNKSTRAEVRAKLSTPTHTHTHTIQHTTHAHHAHIQNSTRHTRAPHAYTHTQTHKHTHTQYTPQTD